MTDYINLGSSLVLVRCLVKTKAYDQSKSSGKIRHGTISSFWTVFVKEDRETGKAVQRLCLFMRKSAFQA